MADLGKADEADEDIKSKTFSNEAVIDEIISGMGNVSVENEPSHPLESSTGDMGDIMDEIDSENDQSHSDDEPKEDFIDEEHLKELEKNQTDEEKAKLKEDAQKLKEEGNKSFQIAEFEVAIKSYTKALQCCPISFAIERSILYANRATARSKLERNEEAVMDCTKALDLNPNYVKAVTRRAQLYQKMDKLDEALSDYQRVLELDGNVLEAREAVMRLPQQINERNEKLKTEMLGKLKDLGNMILRPFGLSTDNFNLVKDEASGGYSVNFQQNSTK